MTCWCCFQSIPGNIINLYNHQRGCKGGVNQINIFETMLNNCFSTKYTTNIKGTIEKYVNKNTGGKSKYKTGNVIQYLRDKYNVCFDDDAMMQQQSKARDEEKKNDVSRNLLQELNELDDSPNQAMINKTRFSFFYFFFL